MRPQDMSVMCSRPSTPPRSMKAPYSVMFLTTPLIRMPTTRFLRVSRRFSSRPFSSTARRESTTLPRWRLSLRIFIRIFWPTNWPRSRTGRRSTCEPGRKPRTPMSTASPPLILSVTTPSISRSSSKARVISSQTLALSAFSLERIRCPSAFSASSRKTSISSPTAGTLSRAELVDRDRALGLEAHVDEDLLVRDLDDPAPDDLALLEVDERLVVETAHLGALVGAGLVVLVHLERAPLLLARLLHLPRRLLLRLLRGVVALRRTCWVLPPVG